MTAKTWADPEPIDLSASSGALTIDTTPPSGTPDRSYFKLAGLPEGRIYQLTVTDGTGVSFTSEYGDWTWNAFNPAYPTEHLSVGRHNPYNTDPSTFYCAGIDLVLAIRMVTHGTVTLTWTSIDWAERPYTWSDPDPIELPSGTLAYDALNRDTSSGENAPGWQFGQERHYVFAPSSADPVTIQTNEPSCYYEVYRETGNYSFDDYIEDGTNLVDGTPDPIVFTPEVGQTYHLVVYPKGEPTTSTAYTLSWTQGSIETPYVVANDDAVDAIDLGQIVDGLTHGYDNTGATAGES